MATQSEVAQACDLSTTQLKNLQGRGIVQKARPGKLDLEACVVAYIRHLRKTAAGRGGDNVADLAAERARLAQAQTRAQELKNAELEGRLVDRQAVIEVVTTRITAAKSKLRGIPKRAVRRIPGLTREMAQALLKMIDEVLNDLAGDTVPAARPRGRRKRHR